MRFHIVDDDPDVLALMRHVLEKDGHEVATYVSGRQALSDIVATRPDCVIVDVMMPDMDGLELCAELRRHAELAATKIVMLSIKPYDLDRRRAKELGANGYLVKPVEPDTLVGSLLEILSNQIVLTHWGVRGTLPVSGPATLRYGGSTSCTTVEVSGEPLFVFDCGTGIKALSDYLDGSDARSLSARIFVSHTHWDHINTLPFFSPLYAPGNDIEVLGPHQGDITIADAVSAQMNGVYFPVTTREFRAHVTYRNLREESLQLGPVRIDTMLLRHPGYCLGYRLAAWDRTICYVTDNELYPPSDSRHDARYLNRLVEFVRGADVLVTDTTYRDHEYPSKVDWGHSCVSQVADLAARAQVARLHLFHHDPDQTDNDIDRKLIETREQLRALGSAVECHAPAEGMRLVL